MKEEGRRGRRGERLTALEVRGHVEVLEGEGNVSADLGREVGVKTEPLQMHTEHLWSRQEGGMEEK